MKSARIIIAFLIWIIISALFLTSSAAAVDIASDGLNVAASTVSINTLTPGTTSSDYKTVTYSASISGGTASKWEWDFNNDGTIDKTDTSGASSCSGSYTYSAAGTYTVKLKVTSSDSTPNTPTKTVTITAPELAAATVTIDSLTISGTTWSNYKTVTYSASISGGTATKWEWDFNNDGTVDKTDTSGASSCSGSYTYSAAGTYTAKLKVTSSDSTPNTPTKSVTIKEPPLVASMDLELDDNELDYDSTTTGASSWSWTFGDSGTSTLDNGTHTYTKSGKFNVKLTVKSPAGNTSSITETVYLDKVVAYFTADKSSGSAPLTVKFTDESTENYDTKDDIVKWVWNFDDGSTKTTILEGTDPDITHTFTKEGDYDVTLTVTDDDGDTDSYEMKITVDDDVAPNADFDLYSNDYDDEGTAPLTVRFIDESEPCKKTNSSLKTWYWEFINEDDTVVYYSWSQNPPSYTFDDPGKYTIQLTVTDDDGASDTETKEDYIEVTLGLSATFSASTTSGYKPLSVTFTATPGTSNDYSIKNYYWDFGDGYKDTTTSKTISHTYTSTGTYTVKMTVTDTEGYTYTYTKNSYITVKDTSSITAAATQATAAPTEVLVSAAASGGEQIFGIPGTEYFRDEMERFYGFYEEYLSILTGMFGMS